jgi:hypothetical protein
VICLHVTLREEPVCDGIVNDAAVRRAAAGEPVSLSHSERAELIRVLLAAGAPARRIAEHLGMTLGAVEHLQLPLTART